MLRWCLILLSLATGCSASLYNKHQAIGMGCARAAQDLFTACNQEDYACFCNSNTFTYAVQNCIAQETNFKSLQMGLAFDKFDQMFCRLHNLHANTTDVFNENNQKLNPTVSEKAFQLAYEGERNNFAQKEASVYLGVGLVMYWATILLFIAAIRIFKQICIYLFYDRSVMRRASSLERWLQKRLFWPALFNSRHLVPLSFLRGWISFSVPTRFESVVVFFYILMAVIFMLTPYTFMNNDPLFQTRWKEMMRYASDRSGIMATIQFPLLTCFALRNNIFQWLCGWSYSSFNTCHRAIARVTYALLIVHAVTKHIFSASYGGSLVKYYYPAPYFRWGCAAMGLFALMIMMAMMRNRCHEIFYRLHQLMALAGFICSIFHLKGLTFKEPLWISIALWASDWIIRAIRILLYNINFIVAPLPGSLPTTFARVQLFQDEIMKLTIKTPVRWSVYPGQFVFLHLSKWSFIGGHPFSVVGSSECKEGLELLVKARGGLTRKLFTLLDKRGCNKHYAVTIPAYVEGPYGNSVPVQRYHEGLFFAGGIGITGVLGYIEKMARASSDGEIPKHVRLFWSIRSLGDIESVSDRLVRLRKYAGVTIHIYNRKDATAMDIASTATFSSVGKENPEVSKDPKVSSMGWSDIKIKSSTNILEYNARSQTQRQTSSWAKEFFKANRLSKYGKPIETEEDKESKSRKHQRKLSHPIESIMNFVNRNSASSQPRNEWNRSVTQHTDPSAEDDSSLSFESSNESSTKEKDSDLSDDQTNTFARRGHSMLSEAGFTDASLDRNISIVNPFDDEEYVYEAPPDFELNEEMDFEPQMADNPNYKDVIFTRMDVKSLLRHYLKRSEGSVCVVGCGPDRMMDTLCSACCEYLDLAMNGRVDYYEEAFKW